MQRRTSCLAGSSVKLKLELERLYERRSLLTIAIGALERWRDANPAAQKCDFPQEGPDLSNLTTCRRA
jgi:predicted subunit of tRNA(5-methylaminomethyl-2-thiouridylate) methyltransferase